MRLAFAILLTVSACSSWKDKDFKKDLQKSVETKPQVQVDEKLLEKFEVTPAVVQEPTPVEVRPSLPNKPNIRPPVKPVVKSAPQKPATNKPVPTPTVKPDEHPKYPSELKALNLKAKKVWDLYRPNHFINEKIFLDINYLGMTVGKIMFTNKGKKSINDDDVWHFHARFKSAPFYSNIYELDDSVDTYVSSEKFLSTRYSLIQRESKQEIDDLQLHDRDKLKTFWFYKNKRSDGKVKNKNKEGFIPYYSIDPFSVLFFFQGLPLKNGDTYEIPIINKSKILTLKSLVEGREVVVTKMGDRKAIRVHATTQYTGEHLKSGDLYLWFSDDEKRTLLKVQAKIKIGSVTAEIVDNE